MKSILNPKDLKRLNKLLAQNEAQLIKIREQMARLNPRAKRAKREK